MTDDTKDNGQDKPGALTVQQTDNVHYLTNDGEAIRGPQREGTIGQSPKREIEQSEIDTQPRKGMTGNPIKSGPQSRAQDIVGSYQHKGPNIADGLTHTQDKFCQLVAYGSSLTHAYAEAFRPPASNKLTIQSAASNLHADQRIKDRI